MVEANKDQLPKGTVYEGWSRTVGGNQFRPTIDTRRWSFRPEDKWGVVPDEHSQVDFRIFPGDQLSIPEQVLKVLGSKPNEKVEVTIRPQKNGTALVVMVGFKLEVNRTPDEQSIPARPIDIDNW